ncbi:exo-alpha-sialidase [Phormidium tenue FACHB-886]|nr:exo-alpha-sialidase [Phormidium tenue FACHB-886]
MKSKRITIAILFFAAMLAAVLFSTHSFEQVTLAAETYKQVTVAAEPGRFKGWPANGGIWSWGDEILVMYTDGNLLIEDPEKHAINYDQPIDNEQARSLDGGRTWTIEKGKTIRPGGASWEEMGNNGTPPKPLETPMNFADPNFAFHVEMQHHEFGFSRFWYSTDRGKTWQGSFQFPDLGFATVNARTNYIINSDKDMMLMVTVGEVSDHNSDGLRNVLIQTTDGGLTWRVVANAGRTPALKGREASNSSIMGTLTRLSPTKLISLHREWDGSEAEEGWIEAWDSNDNGNTWKFLSRISTNNTSTPPSVVKLPTGRLVLSYGYRSQPFGIRARLSDDEGKTWSNEIVLRTDGGNFDLGYTRDTVKPDGTVVTVYYYNTNPRAERQIEATLWNPAQLSISSIK